MREGTLQARVIEGYLRHDQLTEATRRYQVALVPHLQSLAGFVGTLLLTDPATGRARLIILWATDAEMQVAERQGFFTALALLTATFVGTPQHETYLVAGNPLQEMRG